MSRARLTRPRGTRRTLAVLALAPLLAPLLGAAPASAAPNTTKVRPATLEESPATSVPHVVGRTIVEGEQETRVRGRNVLLLGTVEPGAHVVSVRRKKAGEAVYQVRLVRHDAADRTLLTLRDTEHAIAGQDGSTFVVVRYLFRREVSRLRAFALPSGDEVARVRQRGYPSVLDARLSDDGGEVLLGRYERNVTSRWDLGTGKVTRVVGRAGFRADLAADRLASFTKDPYEGGCTVVSSLSDPDTRLWRSCEEAVETFSADGTRMTTTHILSDGIGPRQVIVREDDGSLVRRYRTDGFFARSWFEAEDTVLLDTRTGSATGVVRCVTRDCEVAGDVGPGDPWL